MWGAQQLWHLQHPLQIWPGSVRSNNFIWIFTIVYYRCPCLEDLNLEIDEFAKVRHSSLPDQAHSCLLAPPFQIQQSLNSNINTIRDGGRFSPRKDLMMSERPLSEVWKGVFVEPGACLPVCCPTLRCTPELCPRCHQRNKESPEACPCLTFWTQSLLLFIQIQSKIYKSCAFDD